MGKPVDWEADVLSFVRPDGARGTRDPDEVQRKHIFEAISLRFLSVSSG